MMRHANAAALALAMLAGGWLGIAALQPPEVVPAGAPAELFSAARAMQHVRAIARAPHPTGSAEQGRVRAHLVAQLRGMGLEPQVQRATASWNSGHHFRIAEVANVLARVPGQRSRAGAVAGAVMLVAHYDSAPTSPGAADDAASVGALLETARALMAGAPLPRDVIILFTDGEERGLMGARAFVAHHPWRHDVAVVLNFEARGVRGPSLMFETSGGAAPLVDVFGRAAARPIAVSYASAAYGAMDNDTDFSVFARAGMPGLNFAFIGGESHYHTALDRVENLDPRSVQHHGENALSLARALARHQGPSRADDAVYFNLPAVGLVSYSERTGVALALAALFACAFVLAWSVRTSRMTALGLARGLLSAVLVPAASLGAGYAALALGELVAGGPPLARWHEPGLPLVAVVLLALAAAAAVHRVLASWVGGRERAGGGLALFSLLAVWTSVVAPGAGYLFAIPALLGVAALALSIRLPARWAAVAAALSGAMVLALWAPTVALLTIALGGAAIVLVSALVGLVHLVSLSQVAMVPGWSRPSRQLPALLCVGGLLLLLVGLVARGQLDDRPRPNSLAYTLDLDRGEASWVSFDPAPDAWTGSVLASPRREVSEFFPGRRTVLTSPATPIATAGPRVQLVHDDRSGPSRRLRLHVQPLAGTSIETLDLESDGVKSLTAAGVLYETPPARSGRWSVSYVAPPASGYQLTVEIAHGAPLTVRAVDMYYGLPELAARVPPRPAGSMPGLDVPTDATFVRRSAGF